jgi:hypothetical protein
MKKIIIITTLFLLPLVFSNSAFATYDPNQNDITKKDIITYKLTEDEKGELMRDITVVVFAFIAGIFIVALLASLVLRDFNPAPQIG